MGDDYKANIESYLLYIDRLKQQDSPVSNPHTIQSTAPRKRRTRRGHTNKGTMSHQKQLPNEETVEPVAVRNIIWTLSYNEISVICLCRLNSKSGKIYWKISNNKTVSYSHWEQKHQQFVILIFTMGSTTVEKSPMPSNTDMVLERDERFDKLEENFMIQWSNIK